METDEQKMSVYLLLSGWRVNWLVGEKLWYWPDYYKYGDELLSTWPERGTRGLTIIKAYEFAVAHQYGGE
jgi:hypothetical protein